MPEMQSEKNVRTRTGAIMHFKFTSGWQKESSREVQEVRTGLVNYLQVMRVSLGRFQRSPARIFHEMERILVQESVINKYS
jgi:hypothetical protein